MSSYVIEEPARASIAVEGESARFPVRRIYCVGRNYVAHVREMGGTEERNPPIFFQKPADAVVPNGGEVPYPTMTADLHHEVELVLALGSGGRDIAEADAAGHIYGYAVGIDLTRRDIQGGGKPWEIAKSFDHSFPCGDIVPAASAGPMTSAGIELSVNGEMRQQSNVDLMIWRVPEIIARLSQFFELKAGDLILTGTPHGVGPVVAGDRIEASVAGLPKLDVRIV